MEKTVKRVAVIGCGYAGLCTLKHLSTDSCFQVVGFEQADCIGGIWKYPSGCEDHVRQSETSPFFCRIYRDMRTNGPRNLMELEDFPFSSGNDSYCHWKVVNKYLRDYAEHFGLIPHIKFRHRVTQVTAVCTTTKCPNAFEQWNVTHENLDSGEVSEETFDAVAICNGWDGSTRVWVESLPVWTYEKLTCHLPYGRIIVRFTVSFSSHYNKPHLPELRGLSSFTGSVIHSSDYRGHDTYGNQNVLIIGGSISAADIAVELVPVAKKIIIAKPSSVHHQLFPTKLDNVQEIPMIKNLTNGGCVLDNGTIERIDSIILCTGYEFDYPFLHETCQLKVSRGLVTPLYHHMFNCHHPTMAFIFIGSMIVATPVLDYQVKYFKAVLQGEILLPSVNEMLKEADEELSRRLKDGLREHEGHVMDERLWAYIDHLAHELRIPSYEPVCRKLYEKGKELFEKTPLTAKSYVLRKLDSENYIIQPPQNQ